MISVQQIPKSRDPTEMASSMNTLPTTAQWIFSRSVNSRGDSEWKWEKKEDDTTQHSQKTFRSFEHCLEDARRHGLGPNDKFRVVIPIAQ